MPGSKACVWVGENGETCKESRCGTKPATANRCRFCEKTRFCRAHCGCETSGSNAPRGASSVGPRPVARQQPQQPQPQQQPQIVKSRSRSRSRAKREGRRCERLRIEEAFRADCKFLSLAERPLPGPGRLDTGLVPGKTWQDGLNTPQALELLASPQWQQHREVSSVQLTMFLRWAEAMHKQKSEAAAAAAKQKSEEATAAATLGRHISGFLG
jgi:hypothetical protein